MSAEQDNTAEIETIEKNGKAGKGKRLLLAYLRGEKLTRGQAMAAKCYECLGYCVDGMKDCEVQNCPMYPYRPYKNSKS